MEKTSVGQKINLIIFGIICGLVIVELILRLLGIFFVAYAQGFDNPSAQDGGDCYKILCLGDSFTFGLGASKGQDYPQQLEAMLNQRHFLKKFLLINKGRPGQNTSELLYSLDGYLDRYRPDLVIVMTGMNDPQNTHLHDWVLRSNNHGEIFLSWISSLRIFKLFKLARSLSLMRSGENRNINSANANGLDQRKNIPIKKAEELFAMGRNSEAEKILVSALNKDNIWECVNTANKYSSYNVVEHIIGEGLRINPEDSWLRFTLGRLYWNQGRLAEAEETFKYILTHAPYSKYIRYEFAELYISQKKYAEAESLLKAEAKLRGESLRGDYMLLKCYENQGKQNELYKLQKSINKYLRITDIGVMRIIQRIKEKGGRTILMNYPERDFVSQDIARNAIFIDNRKIFGNYSAGKHGRLLSADNHHCSYDGYRLIAENVLGCILENKLFN
ncbi:MAG: tetratricopeptide repeat protein [Deltaproteobacteria bacterium]